MKIELIKTIDTSGIWFNVRIDGINHFTRDEDKANKDFDNAVEFAKNPVKPVILKKFEI